MDPYTEGELADRMTLMSYPPDLRRGIATWKQLANPAAGQNLVYPVSNTYWERIIAITWQLTTVAAGSPREPFIAYQDNNGFSYDLVAAGSTVGQSRTLTYYSDLAGRALAVWPQSANNEGTQTSPAATTTIASVSPNQPGSYQIEWTVELSGTLTAGTDNDNFQLVNGTTVLATSSNLAIAGTYPQQVVDTQLASAGSLAIRNNLLATTGAVYAASLTVTPLSDSGVYSQIPDLVLKSGYQLVLGVTNMAGTDTITNAGLITECYPSNWADGALYADEERVVRDVIRRLASGA